MNALVHLHSLMVVMVLTAALWWALSRLPDGEGLETDQPRGAHAEKSRERLQQPCPGFKRAVDGQPNTNERTGGPDEGEAIA